MNSAVNEEKIKEILKKYKFTKIVNFKKIHSIDYLNQNFEDIATRLSSLQGIPLVNIQANKIDVNNIEILRFWADYFNEIFIRKEVNK